MKKLLIITLSLLSISALSSQLETDNYIVTIEQNCMEGEVICNKVTYIGVNKKNGQSITLEGSTRHSYRADGIPSRFLGYQFKNGNIDYLVTEGGYLTVIRNGSDVLLEEKGKWEW